MDNNNLPVALDAMGGDGGIGVNVEGAVRASDDLGIRVILVGDEKKLRDELSKYKYDPEKITVHHAKENIGMDESPAAAVRAKRDSSIAVATQLVAQRKAGAVVSAGNSGAVMACSLMLMRRLPGITRPAITTLMPTLTGACIILDVGANVDSKPKNLLQFALMGSTYVKDIFGIRSPRVGLLSIGKERNKGNELTLGAYNLISGTDLNFIGNIEGKDIPHGKADVVVCDGFTGNIVLKFGEGVAEMLFKLIKLELKKHPLAFLSIPFLWGAMKDLRKRVDYSEYGGAPLLGIDGVCIICHGVSNSKAIKNALRAANEFVKKGINKKISGEMEKYRMEGNNE